MFRHEEFVPGLQNYIYKDTKLSAGEVDRVVYGPGRKAFLCPEPVTFLDQLDDCAGDRETCRRYFEKMIRSFPEVSLERQPPGGLWFNTTKNGINLRPGMDSRTSKPTAISMGDNGVHGLMAGQTGSGKSVLLNNLIFNMLMEYAPWELDLYLADFKKVEFSRYMNTYATPHICACAATSEIRYVLSLISYLAECMNAREELFARLGLAKIADFRDKYPDLVLPRMLLIVDEFQQLFLEASPKEGEQIRQLMTAIVKKGRATGLHILFASQEMSQTLSRSDLANFRLRFALNCSAGVSMDVIGNRGAAMLPKGTVIFNTSDGTEETNQRFQVPFIETGEDGGTISYFYEYLKNIQGFAGKIPFRKSQKFYKEESQEPFESLEEILDRIREYRKQYFQGNVRKYFEVLTLGSYVTYSNLRYDIQTLFLEYGRNKNILAVSPRMEDLAYLQKLLAVNFTTSPRRQVLGTGYAHRIYSFQPGVRSLISLEKAVGVSEVHTNPEDMEALELSFAKRRMLLQLFQESSTPYEFAMGNYRANLNRQRRNYSSQELIQMEEAAEAVMERLFGSLEMKDIPEAVRRIREGDYPAAEKITAENLMLFYRYRENPDKVFPPMVYWFSGMDSVERIPEWLLQMMKNGMDYNILFVIMANSEFDQMGQVARHCDYIFAGGSQSRLYDRLHMNFTRRQPDSIVLDLNIRSMEEERSFKKYKCSFGKVKAPSIPFDEILKEGPVRPEKP